jgi:hypothetical protein
MFAAVQSAHVEYEIADAPLVSDATLMIWAGKTQPGAN